MPQCALVGNCWGSSLCPERLAFSKLPRCKGCGRGRFAAYCACWGGKRGQKCSVRSCVTPNPGVTSNPLRWRREVCLRTLVGGRDLAQAALPLEVGDLLPHPPPAVVPVALEGQVQGDVVHRSVQRCVVLIRTWPWYFCSL